MCAARENAQQEFREGLRPRPSVSVSVLAVKHCLKVIVLPANEALRSQVFCIAHD